jgi:RNA polymerase sigma-70 factor (ECF subfamily)
LGSPSNSIDPHEQREKLAEKDRELVEAVLRKDRKASAELVSSHADHVYAYVRHRLIPRADLVDDVVQEVFLAAWENLDRYQGSAPLRHWLMGIARHKVEDYYRTRLREPQPMEDEPGPPETAEDPGLEEIMDREQKETRLDATPSPDSESWSEACSQSAVFGSHHRRFVHFADASGTRSAICRPAEAINSVAFSQDAHEAKVPAAVFIHTSPTARSERTDERTDRRGR